MKSNENMKEGMGGLQKDAETGILSCITTGICEVDNGSLQQREQYAHML